MNRAIYVSADQAVGLDDAIRRLAWQQGTMEAVDALTGIRRSIEASRPDERIVDAEYDRLVAEHWPVGS